MSRLAFILFCGVLAGHGGAKFVGALYDNPLAAERAWFYVLRGGFGALMCLTVLALLWSRMREERAAMIVCLWGFLEEGQTSVCRLVYPMNAPPPKPEGGLCDMAIGLPVYVFTVAALLLVVVKGLRK